MTALSPDDTTSSELATGETTEAKSHRNRWLILATLGLAQLMVVLDATVVVTRARAASQSDSGIATGEVTLRLSLELAPERLAEANLATVAPIAICAATAGIDGAAACLDAPADVVLDSSGAH